MFKDSKIKESCGLFGVFNHPEAANLTYLGLYALQHRGQESAGIAASNGKNIHYFSKMGLVADIFKEKILENLTGQIAIGHVRYSTAGDSRLKNTQPFVVDYSQGTIAVAHNGNLVNAGIIRDELEAHGSIFQSTMDTEVIVHLLASSKGKTLTSRISYAFKKLKGAYSLLFLTENELYALRDPYGFRPLVLGKLNDAYIISSETCAFNLIEAEYIREIEPGELIQINNKGVNSIPIFPSGNRKCCAFELIYFARPDSLIFGRNVYEVRKKMGGYLASENPTQADIVIPVPDSGVSAALGYAENSGITFDTGLIRNHYVGRTFIEPRQSIRDFGAKIKLSVLPGYLKGKRLIVIDDSIVRGTNSKKVIKMLRDAGAKEIHIRISSPPIKYPCFYGIDTPDKNELIASLYDLEKINKFLGSDSLYHLTLDCLKKALGDEKGEFCYACFDGNYPIKAKEKDIISRRYK